MSEQTENDGENPENTVESRRSFLKQAGLGAASVGGITGIVGSGSAEASEFGAPVPDPSRSDLGGKPIYDQPRAFDQPILKPLKNRVLALQQLLVDKKLVPKPQLELAVQYYSEEVGPYIGKAVVARCWTDPVFKRALLHPEAPYAPVWRPGGYPAELRGPFSATIYIKDYLDYAAANGQLSFQWPPKDGFLGTTLGPEGDFLRVVANGYDDTSQKRVHNMVVCTLCSCYPQALLGIQPEWYKSRQYRARAIAAPRSVLMEFAESNGNQASVQAYLNDIDEVRVWDSNSEVRWLVIPEMWANVTPVQGNEKQLVQFVTRNGMIGTQIN